MRSVDGTIDTDGMGGAIELSKRSVATRDNISATKIGMAALALAMTWSCGSALGQATPAADSVYINGKIYTADPTDSVRQALAVRDGRIAYVGTDEGAKPYIGPATTVIDLGGRMAMPGLVDGHMHPLAGGQSIEGCSLNYQALTVDQTLAILQACLDKEPDAPADRWLEAGLWFRQALLPAGTDMTAADLDRLKTKRPILLGSSDGHSGLANSRALQLAGITDATASPADGTIIRDAAGRATGMLEDGAQAILRAAIPQPSPEQAAKDGIGYAEAALAAMARQGVTSFLDAAAEDSDLAAFTAVQRQGGLTARGHFAPVIDSSSQESPEKAVARIRDLARQFDQGPLKPEPTITLRNAKMFMDGVIQAPAMTAALTAPYLVNRGTADKPDWAPGDKDGDLYFDLDRTTRLLIGLAEAGIDPHLHTDGDGAVRTGLQAVAAMRQALPGRDIRPAFAHNELVDPPDYARFKDLGVVPVLSFQWGKPAPDTIDTVKDYIGPERFAYLETAGKFQQAGVRIAFGSDWPVDALDEWFALKVGVTRANAPDADARFQGRLGDDPGLTPVQALRTATINAAYELRQDDVTGSLEAGKFADLIVLDRNVLEIPPEDIANVEVLLTVIGGKTVHRADSFR